MTSDLVEMTHHKHMLSPSSLLKIIWVLARNGGGKENFGNHNYCRVYSMSLLNMALLCFCVGVGISHLIFHLLPWVWVILFDLSSTCCLVTMTSDHLMSNTAKSTVVPPICSREVDLCKIINLPLITHIILIHQKYYPPLSCVDDVGNTMAHL